MNYEQNEIDDIFKQGLENNTTPYKNEYWNLMEEMLDEKRNSVFGYGYKKWLSYIGLTSLVLVMMLIGNGTYDSKNIIAKSNNVKAQFIIPTVNNNNNIVNSSNASHQKIKSEIKDVSETKSVRNIVAKTNTFTQNNYTNYSSTTISENISIKKDEDYNNSRVSYFNINPIEYQKFISKNDISFSKNNVGIMKVNEKTIGNIPASKEELSKPNKKTEKLQVNKTEVVSVANLDLHVLGGLTLGNSFNTGDAKNKTNTGFMAGLGFGYYFNKKLSLSIDIMYQKRNGHELERKVTSEEFFLYKKSSTYTLETYNTDYLVLPMQVRYQVKKHHALSLGLYTNFLLNSYNTIYTSVSANNQSSIEAVDDKVNYGGWETVNYGYIISYEFNPTKNIGIGVGYYKGMKDATINSFYRNEKKDLMSDFNLTLKYYLK